MSTIERKDPYTGFNFIVQILEDKAILGSFSEVAGLDIDTEFEEYREGGRNDYVHKLPTITKYQNLVLKRGLTDSNTLYDWEKEIARGKISTKNIRVVLLDSQRREARKWNFKDAFPIKWSSGNLSSTSNSIEIETLELVHKGLAFE
jgi:phage tail-like protein